MHIPQFHAANLDSNQMWVDLRRRILISRHVRIDNSFGLYFETVLVLLCPRFEARNKFKNTFSINLFLKQFNVLRMMSFKNFNYDD